MNSFLNKRGPLVGALCTVGIIFALYTISKSQTSAVQPQQFNPALVEARQKCKADAQQWFQTKLAALTAALSTNNWTDSLTEAHFNGSLNTCLVLYTSGKTDGSEQISQIIDIYQDRILLELDIYTDVHSAFFGTHLYENTNAVKLWPWENTLTVYEAKKSTLLEEQPTVND
jgi:hypothetical protein